MKRKRIISVLFSLVLVLNMALVIECKADAKEVDENTVAIERGIASEMNFEKELMGASNMKARSGEGLDATTVLTSNTALPEYTFMELQSGYYYIVPITAKNTGYMYFDYYVDGGYASDAEVTMEITDYENAMIFDESVGTESYLSYTNTQDT